MYLFRDGGHSFKSASFGAIHRARACFICTASSQYLYGRPLLSDVDHHLSELAHIQ